MSKLKVPLSDGPLIISSGEARTAAQRRTDHALGAIGMFIWSWLWLPVLTLLVWLFFNFKLVAPVLNNETLGSETVLKPVIAGLVLTLVLLLWAAYNALRFAGSTRRRHVQRVPTAEISTAMTLSRSALKQCWECKRLVVHYDDEGRLTAVEAGKKMPKRRRKPSIADTGIDTGTTGVADTDQQP